MQDIDTRSAEATQLWQQGDTALATGNPELAYRKYTEAHDLVVDCPSLHIRAHRKLREVTRYRRPRSEYYTDCVLLWLAPLGVFDLIAWYFRVTAGRSGRRRRAC